MGCGDRLLGARLHQRASGRQGNTLSVARSSRPRIGSNRGKFVEVSGVGVGGGKPKRPSDMRPQSWASRSTCDQTIVCIGCSKTMYSYFRHTCLDGTLRSNFLWPEPAAYSRNLCAEYRVARGNPTGMRRAQFMIMSSHTCFRYGLGLVGQNHVHVYYQFRQHSTA